MEKPSPPEKGAEDAEGADPMERFKSLAKGLFGVPKDAMKDDPAPTDALRPRRGRLRSQ